MKYGLYVPNGGPFADRASMVKVAQQAEKMGFDCVAVQDHINWGDRDKNHFMVGSAEAVEQSGRPCDFFEAISTLSYLAGKTSRIKLLPLALVLPWRNPLIVAKECATLYRLSEGRLILGVCAGNVAGDFRVLNTSWEERGKVTEEYLEVIHRVLRTDEAKITFDGKFTKFEDAMLLPAASDMPLWYAGTSRAALRRTAKFADGWIPVGGPKYYEHHMPILKDYVAGFGRDISEIIIGCTAWVAIGESTKEAHELFKETLAVFTEVPGRSDPEAFKEWCLIGSPKEICERIRQYQRQGVDYFVLGFVGHSITGILESMELFQSSVVNEVS